ncbi:MAG: 4-(cytidine 5'-diphospho)-2-C-methyl-D-erythritol kinase [Clostridia bacterium]|nr:4-(cytidine 5'-diphospho)-2-C-methyl-D-erythritol kinase [Clostridia bacterium]
MIAVKEHAYAKINLYLDVLAKRDDGFHDIKTVMHTVSLSDEITVSVKPSARPRVTLEIIGNGKLPTDGRNLAVQAAELFLSTLLANSEVHIRLIKRIPVSAGLAGGSTDAAAVLRALNKAFGRPLTEKRLLALASELGSDVPYCLLGGTALCLGRGEIIERLPDKLHLYLVVAVADEHVSTPAAYAELDSIYSDFKSDRTDGAEECFNAVLASVESGILTEHKLFNIFENAIFKTCFGAESIKTKLFELGATHSLMSGSGPSIFGIFDNQKSAEAARDELIKSGIRAYYAETV